MLNVTLLVVELGADRANEWIPNLWFLGVIADVMLGLYVRVRTYTHKHTYTFLKFYICLSSYFSASLPLFFLFLPLSLKYSLTKKRNNL